MFYIYLPVTSIVVILDGVGSISFLLVDIEGWTEDILYNKHCYNHDLKKE